MVDRTELLRMIMENNQGQSPTFVLEQYTAYLKGLANIHGDAFMTQNAVCAEGNTCKQEDKAEEKSTKSSITRGFTKRNLVVKPEEAIQEDKIFCCLCGKDGKTLTERHLMSRHEGLTREGYIKLCGYPADQVLMSKNHLESMKKNVLKAQNARKEKIRKERKAD